MPGEALTTLPWPPQGEGCSEEGKAVKASSPSRPPSPPSSDLVRSREESYWREEMEAGQAGSQWRDQWWQPEKWSGQWMKEKRGGGCYCERRGSGNDLISILYSLTQPQGSEAFQISELWSSLSLIQISKAEWSQWRKWWNESISQSSSVTIQIMMMMAVKKW